MLNVVMDLTVQVEGVTKQGYKDLSELINVSSQQQAEKVVKAVHWTLSAGGTSVRGTVVG